MYINCLLSRMAGAYDSCVSIQLRFPFLSTCFHVSSSRLGTRMCGTAVHLVPCLTISLLLSIPLSPHLIWDNNQPRSRYHSYNDIASIRGNQYFLLLIDDATRYITIKFLKAKSNAAQEVQAYLTHLKIRSHVPYAIKVDHGTEFLNKMLQQWCNQNGIEIHATALYFPSQNGVAEHMNHTLVELTCAMLTAAQLPEFLWELAIRHAAYIRNRSYTKVIPEKTPYQG